MIRKVIDVSDYQADMSWKKAAGAGVQGAIVKLTEGKSLQEWAYNHINGALASGIPTGVYVYSHATTGKEAREEAERAVNLIQTASIPTDLGVWFDFESPECLTASNPTQICSDFISKCNEAGLVAGIYASLSTFIDVLSPYALADYVPYWCAQYSDRCEFNDYFRGLTLHGWQYTDGGNIGGVAVDMNEWYV